MICNLTHFTFATNALARRLRCLIMCCVFVCLLSEPAAAAPTLPTAGRRVSDLLDEMRSQGFIFIYSSANVPATLLVQSEPVSTDRLSMIREILAAHRLTLSQAAPRVFAVVSSVTSATTPLPVTAIAPAAPARVEEVVVQTSRYTFGSDAALPATHLTQEQVNNTPRLADETLRAVQRLPGTASNGFSSLGPVRGGDPNEVGIVLDGLRLYEPFHLKNFLSPVSLLDSRLIDGIEFYSGGFPAVYGDRMSSLIDATSVRPTLPRYYELGLSLFHLNGLAAREFAAGRGHALISARRSNIGELSQYSENDFGEPHYADAFTRLDYQFSDATSGSIEALFSSDSIEARNADGTQYSRARYQNTYAWMTLDHTWSERLASRFIASFTELGNRRRGSVDEPAARNVSVRDDRSFTIAGLRIENELDAGPVHHRFGAEIRRLWGQYDYANEIHLRANYPFTGSPVIDSTRGSSPDPAGFESGAWWDARARVGARWTLQTGLRIDTQTYDGSGDGEQWSPRLSALYAWSPQTQLRASWGRYFQSQGINELQVEDGVDRFYPAQQADHSILSIEHSFVGGLMLRIEAYRKDYRRLNPRFENLFDPLVLFPEAEFDRVRVDARDAVAEGVEFQLRLPAHGPWSGWLSYTTSRVHDRIDGVDVPRSWDQRHAINAGAMWASRGWTISLANTFHTGWPTTSLSLVSDAAGRVVIDTSERNRQNFRSFNSLDFRVTRTFVMSRGALDVFVEATNALSAENPCCTRYEPTRAADGTTVYERKVDSWLPLVPSLGVMWRY